MMKKTLKDNAHKISRVLYLFTKLIPILFFPTYLTAKELGIYGLVLGYVYTFIFFIGYEAWFLFNREISKAKNISEIEALFKDQFSIYLPTYLIYIPLVTYLTFNLGGIYVFYTIFLLVTLHLTQELSKLLMAREYHFSSSCIQLIQSSWVIFLPLGYINNANSLISFLCLFSFLSLFFALYLLRRKVGVNLICLLPEIKGIGFYKDKYAFLTIMVLSAWSGKAIFYLSRMILEKFNYVEEVGVISYFYSIVSVVSYFSFYFVQSVYIPKVMKKEGESRKNILRKLKISNTILSVFIFSVMIFLGYYYFYFIVDDNIYLNYFLVYFLYLLSVTILSLSTPNSIILYVNRKDKQYRNSVIFATLYSIVSGGILYLYANLSLMNILATSVLFQSIFIFILRYYYVSSEQVEC